MIAAAPKRRKFTMAELHWTEIDNVKTLWAEIPGPLRAGLLFRTGRVDETLVTAGQTHLIEHLTLSSLDDSSHQHNGFVSADTTGFLTMGNPQGVSDFFARVCDTLQSLPDKRLENEKQVLAAESATRQYDFRSNLLVWRYGATGHGLMGLPELGLQSATPEQLRDFSAQRFTNENAILWLSGPPPTELRLMLPHGVKQPFPTLKSLQENFPCWFVDDICGGVAVGATVPRVSASSVFCEVVSRRLREHLRMTNAVSYSPLVIYEYLDAVTAHLVLYADSKKEHRAELVKLFGEVIEGLDRINASEIDTVHKQIHEYWVGSLAPPPADRLMVDVQRAATDWLLGREFESMETLAADMLSVKPDDVVNFWHQAQSTSMFALPSGVQIETWMGEQALTTRTPVVQGQKVANLDAPIQKEFLVYGPEGVSLIWPDGSHNTVRYSTLAAALHFEDGCLHLIGYDAVGVIIEPTLWHNGQSVCHEIRKHIPSNLLLTQRSRPADEIPKPKTTAWQRLQARLTQR